MTGQAGFDMMEPQTRKPGRFCPGSGNDTESVIIMYYLIRESLTPCEPEDIASGGAQYVAVLTPEEWQQRGESFDLLIDMDMDITPPRETKAVVNQDSLTGSFCIPDRSWIDGPRRSFSFALDEKGIILVDGSGYAEELVQSICRTKKWRLPSLERFLYDLLETTIGQDLALLEKSEHQLNQLEEAILRGEVDSYPAKMNDIRGNLLDLRVHYEQLIDLAQELQENENGFFREENLRYIHLFMNYITRRHSSAASLRDYAMQVRDLYDAQLGVRQNRIMTLLTVVTTIFMPLTLIAGWYGMNFRYMPELDWRWSYPVVLVVSVLIVVFCLVLFKKKKWM